MLRFVKLVCVMSCFMLASCSYLYGDRGVIHNRDTDYLKAQSSPPLRIPPGLSSSTIQSHYPISERVYSADSRTVNLTPPNLFIPEKEKAKPKPVVQEQVAVNGTAKTQVTEAKRPLVPEFYFDTHTRSSLAAGKPFPNWWPSSGSNKGKTVATGGANAKAPTGVNAKVAANSANTKATDIKNKTVSAANNIKDNTTKKGVQNKEQNENSSQVAQNDTSNQDPDQFKMQNAYVDRLSHR